MPSHQVGPLTPADGRDAGRRHPRVATIVVAGVGVYFALTLAGVVLAPVMPNNRYVRAVALLVAAAVVVAGLRPLIGRGRPRAASAARVRRVTGTELVVAGAACVGLAAAAVGLASSTLYHYSWDAGVIERATQTPRTPKGLVTNYFALYPNNLPFLGFARLVRRAGSAMGVTYESAFVYANGAFLFITLVATWVCLRAFASRVVAGLGVALVFFFVALSPWMLVGYTDLPSMATLTVSIAASVWALAVKRPRAQLLLFVVAGLSLGVGLSFKPMPAVLLVAALATLLVSRREVFPARSWMRATLCGAAFAAVCLGAYVGATHVLTARSHTSAADLAATPPQTQLTWVASGSHYERTDGIPYFGGYDGALVRQTSGRPASEQNAMARRSIEADYHRRGPVGTLSFYAHKNIWNWGDGMFWAYGEGHDAHRPVIERNALTPAVSAWNRPDGSLWVARSSVTTGAWIGVLALLAFGLWRARRAAVPHLLFLALSCLGIASFNEIFQARSRYVFAFVPVVVITMLLALYGGTRRQAPSAAQDPLEPRREPRPAAG